MTLTKMKEKVTGFPLRSSVCNLNNTLFNIGDERWSWRRWRDREGGRKGKGAVAYHRWKYPI
jgi:hypothetical protein